MTHESANDLKDWVAVLCNALDIDSRPLDSGEWCFETAAGTACLVEPGLHPESKSLVVSARIGQVDQTTERDALLALLALNTSVGASAPVFSGYHPHSECLTVSYVFAPHPDRWSLANLLETLREFTQCADSLAASFANKDMAIPAKADAPPPETLAALA